MPEITMKSQKYTMTLLTNNEVKERPHYG